MEQWSSGMGAHPGSSGDETDRRTFLKQGAALSTAIALGPLAAAAPVHAAGSDTIRVGLIGCGGRGRGAAENCVRSSEGVELVAIGDLFADRLEDGRRHLSERLGDAWKVTGDRLYSGFDAYRRICALDDVDLVILTTPPVFRDRKSVV